MDGAFNEVWAGPRRSACASAARGLRRRGRAGRRGHRGPRPLPLTRIGLDHTNRRSILREVRSAGTRRCGLRPGPPGAEQRGLRPPWPLARERVLPVRPAAAPGLSSGVTSVQPGRWSEVATSLALALLGGAVGGGVVGRRGRRADAGPRRRGRLRRRPRAAGAGRADAGGRVGDGGGRPCSTPSTWCRPPPVAGCAPADARRLAARARERGSVLVRRGRPRRWPEAADVSLTVTSTTWEGLGQGHGHLRARRAVVEAGGRRGRRRARAGRAVAARAAAASPGAAGQPVPVARRLPAVEASDRVTVGADVGGAGARLAGGGRRGACARRAGRGGVRQPGGGVPRRRPGPTASRSACGGGSRRPAARSWPCSTTTPAATPAPSNRSSPPSPSAIAPRIEVVPPGHLAFATRGPSRYFGGDDRPGRAGRRSGRRRAPAPGRRRGRHRRRPLRRARCAAALRHAHRARRRRWGARRSSPRCRSTPSLDGVDDELLDVLRRLGLRTLGAVAALDRRRRRRPLRHRRRRPPTASPPGATSARRPPPTTADLAARVELDPPAERVETAAFVARGLADELRRRLAAARPGVHPPAHRAPRPSTASAIERLWRGDGAGGASALTAGAIADRVRWQLDGWLGGASGASGPPPASPCSSWCPTRWWPPPAASSGSGAATAGADDRAVRAVARVAGLLGLDAVTVPEWRGGRVAGRAGGAGAGGRRRPRRRPRPHPGRRRVTSPWPGSAARPVARDRPPRAGRRRGGRPPTARPCGRRPRRACVTADPRALVGRAVAGRGRGVGRAVAGGGAVVGPARARRRARLQVVTADGVARLARPRGRPLVGRGDLRLRSAATKSCGRVSASEPDADGVRGRSPRGSTTDRQFGHGTRG